MEKSLNRNAFLFSSATVTTGGNGAKDTVEMQEPEVPASSPSGLRRDPYRGVILVLLLAALVGTAAAIVGGVMTSNAVLFEVAITLGLAAGILTGVAMAQSARARLTASGPPIPQPAPADADAELAVQSPQKLEPSILIRRLKLIYTRGRQWLQTLGALGAIRVGTAIAGTIAVFSILMLKLPENRPDPLLAGVIGSVCLLAAGLAAIAARYLGQIDLTQLPEARGLCQGSRLLAWIFGIAVLSMGLQWAQQQTALRVLYFVLFLINAAVCYALLTVRQSAGELSEIFPVDLAVLSALGSRPNIFASILDTGEQQLGIDLRSTWALTVVRRSLEPLVIGLCFVAWLSTSLTVVGVEEEGLVERLGVPVQGQTLMPGLHLHWPWPIDRVFRISVKRVQALTVGHEGEEEGGPENVLWARQHAENEYTLLLGNGRDLITIDAAVQYRITDPRAWRYHVQNPADALRAIAYRVVMRSTVNRTLADALSENVVTLTGSMGRMVQQEANALGLGVEVVGFTVGGMHPPVPVAGDYEAVVSAELGKVTAVVNAQAFRNESVPAAEAAALVGQNTARAEGAETLARGAGEAWSFRTLESQYHAAPEEYFFRRRLETLEKNLAGRSFVVVDSRIQRDGGDLWLMQ
jgi:regulator of protease activity HflC (stomatin/prohibitin superfamily)